MEEQKRCPQQRRKRVEGREVQGENLCQAPTAGPGLISLDGSGGHVDVEIKCLHNRLCQRANETSPGHTSGLATDEGKPEGTAGCEGRRRGFCFPPFRADRRRHQFSL